MTVTVTGLDQLRDRIKTARGEVTRARRQEEGRIVRDYAREISPTDTGAVKKGWRYRTNQREFLVVVNEVPYSPYVHTEGDDTLIVDRVREFAQERAPQLAEDLAQLVSDHINQT